MPYDIPVGFGLFVIGIRNGGGGESAESSVRFGVDYTGTGPSQAEFDTFSNTVRDRLKQVWDANWTVGPTEVTFRTAAGLFKLENASTETGTATAADYASPAVASVWTKRSVLVGVRNRGRMYMPGVPETLVTEAGLLDATYRNDLQVQADGLLSDVTADPTVDGMVILHSTGLLGTPTPVSRIDVQPVVGTMRPRQRR